MANSLKVSDAGLAPPADRSSSSSEPGKRTHLHRWAISLAVALLLHGVVAVAVLLKWQQPTAPLRPNGPIIVELPPPSAEPSTPLGEPVPAPAGESDKPASAAEHAEQSRPPSEPLAEEIAAGKSASANEENAEPTFATQSPAPSAPLENAEGENGTDVRTASGGGVRSAAPGGEATGGPIEAGIAPNFGASSRKASRTLAPKPIVIGGASKNTGAQAHSRHLGGLPGIAINAIGVGVPDRVGAAIAGANGAPDGAKNAIGSNVASLSGGISGNPSDLTVTNAIGIAVRVRPPIAGLANGEHGSGALAGRGMPVAAVNGTGMTRAGLGGGAVGGPAKNVMGGISGTSFQPRRP